MISQLEALNSLDTIYFNFHGEKFATNLWCRRQWDVQPRRGKSRMRIIINSDVRFRSSYVRFDSLQFMDWPERPFNLIYLTLLPDESFKRKYENWNHLHYDSIQ